MQSPFKRIILITIVIIDLLSGMEFDLFVPSFPQLHDYFNLTPFWVEALLSINYLGYCLSLFFVGSLADYYGRKRIIILGLTTFIFGSLLCLCPFYSLIFIGRFLQGVGIAAPAVLSFLIIADTYPLKQQQFLMGIMNGAINIAIAIAPVLGSYITLYFHWQGNFVVLLLFGSVALAMTLLFIPSMKTPHPPDKPFSFSAYFSILQSTPLVLLFICLLFIFTPYWIFVGMAPLLYMKELQVSLNHFGYYQGVLALVFAFGSIIYGIIIKNSDVHPKKMLNLSLQILLISLICMLLLTFINSKNPLLITLVFIPFIIGQVIPTIILYPLCLNFIPTAKGRISAMLQGFRLILTAIALQIVGYFYQGTFYSIGIMVSFFIAVAVMTLYFVMHHRALMDRL